MSTRQHPSPLADLPAVAPMRRAVVRTYWNMSFMATSITGPSRISDALVSRQSTDTSPTQPANAPASAASPITAAHRKTTRHDNAHAGVPTAGVPRDSLASPTITAANLPPPDSARLCAAKQMLNAAGFSSLDAQKFFDNGVAEILSQDPRRLDAWLAGLILAASHQQSAPSSAAAPGSQASEDSLALLTQHRCTTDEQRVEFATWVALPEAELRHRLAESSASSSRPAA